MPRPRNPPPTSALELHLEGGNRRYLLHEPRTLPAEAPLVVELHGRGIDPLRFDRLTGFAALADEQGFVLVLPSAVDGIWNSRPLPSAMDRADDVAYLLAVIDDVCARLPIHRRRIYVVGMSNGAGMAGRLARLHPERLAAFAQVAGTGPDDLASGPRPACPVPILQIHGTADGSFPTAAGCGGDP